jgi:hypothetical protein
MVTVSERRLEANRRNAMRSTGPRTPEGKAVVALNAMKHGLLSREVLVKGETEADLVAFARRMRAQLAPLGELELLLADRIISTAWRLRRAIALEAMLLGEKDSDRSGSLNPFFHRPTRDRLLTFSRYEAGLERSLYKALSELRRLQTERGSEPVMVLDAEDVEASGADAGEGA